MDQGELFSIEYSLAPIDLPDDEPDIPLPYAIAVLQEALDILSALRQTPKRAEQIEQLFIAISVLEGSGYGPPT